jgi:protein-S-isoprenylcysteine O-methyltransferase Ste14
VTRAGRAGGLMKPYFETHATWALLVVVLAWFMKELIGFLQVQERQQGRAGAVKTGARPSYWLAGAAGTAAMNAWLYSAPPVIPAATIRPGAAAFAEENALLTTIGDRYRRYASHHSRLVPFVW